MDMKKKREQSEEERTILSKPKDTFKNELEDRINLGKSLNNQQIKSFEQLEKLKSDFQSWDEFNKELLKRSFNKINNEYHYDYYNSTESIGFFDVMYRTDRNTLEYKANNERKRIDSAIKNLERLVEKLPLIEQDPNIQSYTTNEKRFSNKCFLVHGRNEMRKYKIARYLENDLNKKTIILHEKPNKGRTIIEKFVDYTNVDFAIALWTADDEGKIKNETDLKARARQNVIFETGFFIGKLGRENVIVLYEEGVEIPSDYSGVIFIPLIGNWKDDLRKEVNEIYTQ